MVDQTTEDAGLDLFSEFAVTDEGVWVPYKGDVEFLIARYNNPKFRRRLGYYYEKNKRLLDGKGQEAEKKSNEVMAQAMAEGILLDWKGKIAFQGQTLTYSVANATKLLQLETFRAWVTKQSQDEETYKVVKDEEDAENF